jgi:hypothetical protein
VRFLSDEWLDALDAAVRREPRFRTTSGDLVIQQTVTGTEWGDVTYRIELGPDGGRVAVGAVLDPTVALATDLETAQRTARGEAAALHAVLDGRIRIEGDVARLLEVRESLAQPDDTFAAVRAVTEW